MAKLLIYRYGEGAADYAARRAEELRAQGKADASAAWEKIVAEINAQKKNRN
jgi:hypothetical protein